MKKLLILISCLLVGCSTLSNKWQPTNIPPSRIYEQAYVKPFYGADAVLFIRRDVDISGSACPLDVFIDNTRVFTIFYGEHITIHVPPGAHFLWAQSSGTTLTCQNASTSIYTMLRAGEEKTFGIRLKPMSTPTINQM